ncbi:MAG: 6-carboxytetrahydropterin synthase QueD [Candidatus Omnitrophica bacterium]|nr:6-carboxytetrahydropterin synthase QueD [Candidatus Omnitrophota bacterium]
MFEIKVTEQFCASHQLRGHDGRCENLHGHNWQVDVAAESRELDKIGVVVDFEEVKRTLHDILEEFDHRNLNDCPPFDNGKNPTAELLAEHIYASLEKAFGAGRFRFTSVTVWETKDACATYRP